MGLHCEIHLSQSENRTFKVGSKVRGFVKYAVDKETVFTGIVIFLECKAVCRWSEKSGKKSRTYTGHETVYTLQNVIQQKTNEGELLAVGSYVNPFNFEVPKCIPQSYKDEHCTIKHILRIEFMKPGIFSFNRHYSIVINVIGDVIHEEHVLDFNKSKTLTQLFQSKKSNINISGTIDKYIVKPGGQVHLDCIIENDTNLTIQKVKTEVKERRTYKADGSGHKYSLKTIEGCKVCSESIKPSDILKYSPVIQIPDDIFTISHTRVFKREYWLLVTVKLPAPHWNMEIEIPLCVDPNPIGENYLPDYEEMQYDQDAPPSYWEVMNEDNINDN